MSAQCCLRDLQRVERKLYSQNGEDGVLLHLLSVLPNVPPVAVEIGVWAGPEQLAGGEESNTRVLLDDSRWRVVRFDAAAPAHHPTVRRAWVTSENVNDLLAEAVREREIGVFSLDIDGMDYWIWRALDQVRAAIVIVEFNVSLGGLEHCVSVPYEPSFRWDFSGRCGASLGAFVRLAQDKGYRLVHCTGPNAFFVAEEYCRQFELDSPANILARHWGFKLGTPDPRYSLTDVSDPRAPVPWRPSPRAALAGVRVLDLSRCLRGKLVASMFAELGADVLRIDPVSNPPVLDAALERNKYALALDLTQKEGRRILRQIARAADVWIESHPWRALEPRDAHERLAASYPSLVLVLLEDGQECRDPQATSAMGIAFGALAALRAREATGRGQVVAAQASSDETAMACAWPCPSLSETPALQRWPARPSGHDSESILRAALGIDGDQYERLRAAGIVSGGPEAPFKCDTPVAADTGSSA